MIESNVYEIVEHKDILIDNLEAENQWRIQKVCRAIRTGDVLRLSLKSYQYYSIIVYITVLA